MASNIIIQLAVRRRVRHRGEEVKHLADGLRSVNGMFGGSNLLVPEVARCAVEQRGEGAVGIAACRPIELLPKLRGEAHVRVIGMCKGRSRRRLELTKLIECTIRNMRARATALNKSAVGKRQIPPPAAFLMAPPVDIGEGLVVEGEAAEEDLGACLDRIRIILHITPLGLRIRFLIIVRRICFSLKLGDEGRGGVADGGEDGGVGEEILLVRISIDFANFAVKIWGGAGDASNASLKLFIV
ncbi:uncharacterized protein BcabD6B2_08550 [Babesia caballi]|uniref:Uncharacterized protein n=1 Tax=Babesia caballi TaxID=5871 RepID=A0AAV4LNA2_BABCB|nr:hypothetical protein BcabD6B2_08550 [Babesia caballi]